MQYSANSADLAFMAEPRAYRERDPPEQAFAIRSRHALPSTRCPAGSITASQVFDISDLLVSLRGNTLQHVLWLMNIRFMGPSRGELLHQGTRLSPRAVISQVRLISVTAALQSTFFPALSAPALIRLLAFPSPGSARITIHKSWLLPPNGCRTGRSCR